MRGEVLADCNSLLCAGAGPGLAGRPVLYRQPGAGRRPLHEAPLPPPLPGPSPGLSRPHGPGLVPPPVTPHPPHRPRHERAQPPAGQGRGDHRQQRAPDLHQVVTVWSYLSMLWLCLLCYCQYADSKMLPCQYLFPFIQFSVIYLLSLGKVFSGRATPTASKLTMKRSWRSSGWGDSEGGRKSLFPSIISTSTKRRELRSFCC